MSRIYDLQINKSLRTNYAAPAMGAGGRCTDVNGGAPRPLPEPPARGLSKGHNRPDCKAVVSVDGSSVELRRPYLGDTSSSPVKAKRERITKWSEKSRMRLKWMLGTLKKAELGKAVFVTLTYPAEFPAPDDHGIYKGHLKAFCKELRRCWGAAMTGIWKLEFQQRGAAHYHLLLLGITEATLEKFRDWTAKRWYHIVNSQDEKHLRAGTGVDAAKTAGGAMCYLAKYVSKDDQTRPGNFTGRYWGVIGREGLPVSRLATVLLHDESMIKVQRWSRKLIKVNMKCSRWNNFLASKKGERHRAMFGESIQDWDRLRSAYHSGSTHLEFVGKHSAGWVSTAAVRSTYEMSCVPPGRWNLCNNTNVRLLCNGSAFLSMLEKGMLSGLLFSYGFDISPLRWAWPEAVEPLPF